MVNKALVAVVAGGSILAAGLALRASGGPPPPGQNLFIQITLDKTSYAPNATMTVTLQIADLTTGVPFPLVAQVTLTLNGVPQKLIATDTAGHAATTLIAPLGTGTHTLQASAPTLPTTQLTFTVA